MRKAGTLIKSYRKWDIVSIDLQLVHEKSVRWLNYKQYLLLDSDLHAS